MKEIILVLLILCVWVSVAFGGVVIQKVSSESATDYTAHANCMGVWYMNSSDNETDRSGEGGTLIDSTAGSIPTSATVPSGYSGTSRDIERDNVGCLWHADGLSTDITGADQQLTLVAWIRSEAITDGRDNVIIGKYVYTTDDRQYILIARGTGTNTFKLQCKISSDGSSGNQVTAETDTTTYASGTWYHVACVYDDTDIDIFVGGSSDIASPPAHTAGISVSSGSGGMFQVGDHDGLGSGNGVFDGLIDEVGVFNTALSSAQITEIKDDGISGNKGGND